MKSEKEFEPWFTKTPLTGEKLSNLDMQLLLETRKTNRLLQKILEALAGDGEMPESEVLTYLDGSPV